MPASAASRRSSRPRSCAGMGDRVLSWRDGERHMTDLAHITQLLQDVAHREHYRLPALRDWLRANATTAAARPSATAGWTATPRRCRS